MSVTTPGPAADLISYAARIIVAAMKQPHTAPGHWAGALWEAGMLVAPGTGSTTLPEIRDRDAESTSAALARVTAERDYALNLAEALRRTIAELADERDHARSERDALKALHADAVNRLNDLTREPPRLDTTVRHPAD